MTVENVFEAPCPDCGVAIAFECWCDGCYTARCDVCRTTVETVVDSNDGSHLSATYPDDGGEEEL